MSEPQTPYHDTFTVTKGPEDGARFVLTESPVLIGRDSQCVVNLQLDVTVQPQHARATPDNGAYRIRRLTAAPVHVNGKRVGHVRSKRLAAGGILRVGYTELILSCAPNGLATQSGSGFAESDAAWAIRGLGSQTAALMKQLLRGGIVAGGFLARHWVLTLLAVIVLIFLQPRLREMALDLLRGAAASAGL